MDARAKSVREILHSGDQYLIPFFQRSYSWDKAQWKRLTDDLEALLEDDSRAQHFLGPLVCTPGQHVPGEVNAYQLIDGQQRLTTLSLLLTALRDAAIERSDTDFAAEIEEDLLIHKRKPGVQRYKIVPRLGDRDVYIALLDRKELERTSNSSLLKAHSFFRKWIDKREPPEPTALKRVFAAVADRLSLVVITIAGENPYEIFESLNSTGLPLEESDLIRNYVFMQVPLAQQDEFNKEHWGPFEALLQEKRGDVRLGGTDFYRDYLMRRGRYSKRRATFIDFKEQNRARNLPPADQVKELRRFVKFARLIADIEQGETALLSRALRDLRELEVSTATPLLLALFDRWQSESLTTAELCGCLSDVASFVLRRSACTLSTRAYGKWFADAIARLRDDARTSLQEYFAERGWPSDRTFCRALAGFDVYRREPKKCRLILDRLEAAYGHKERVDPSVLSIEHVLPQKPNEAAIAEFLATLDGGGNWFPAQQRLLHTLGNLTLTGYNPELSNHPYSTKRRALLESHLVLNDYFKNVDRWGAAEIEARGATLATEVAIQWPNPMPSPDDLGDATPRWRNAAFDISGLRQASVEKLAMHFGVTLENEAEARFIGPNLRLVCLAARPRQQGHSVRYWFGITPGQLEFLNHEGAKYVALSCGSPDRVFLFTFEEFEPLTRQMDFTENTDPALDEGLEHPQEKHWHVQVFWDDHVVSLDLPKGAAKLDITARLSRFV